MITLLPALLVITGRWVFWPLRPRYGSPEPTTRGFWARVGRGIAVRPRTVWVATAVVLACAWLGLIGFKIGPLTTAQSYRGTPPSVAAQQVLDRHFPGGSGEPVAVIGNAAAASRLHAALASTPGIAAVTPPAVKGGLVYLQGTLAGPPDSPAATAAVERARTALHAIPGANAKVGGGTAINIDVEHYATRDRNLIIPLVLFVVLVILGLLLRSVVAAFLLIGTVVLSFGAALGCRRWYSGTCSASPAPTPSCPAVRVRVPGRPGHRLQHLPDDQGARGKQAARHQAGCDHRPGGHRRGDHLGRRWCWPARSPRWARCRW